MPPTTPATTSRPLALVTGASSGIGRELATLFAQDGYDLVIAAEDEGLTAAARQLRADGGIVVEAQCDLRQPAGVEQLWRSVQELGRPLDAAALNAGIGAGKAFVDEDLANALSVVDLNVRGTVHLAHLVLQQLVNRNEGQVLLTSSIASEMPGAFQAVYNASKSFVQSFAEALQEELKDSAVTVTSLMPGPTDTNFFARAGLLNTMVGQGKKDDPAEVARDGYDAMRKGERRVVSASLKTKVMSAGSKITPDAVKAKLHRGMAEPKK